MPAEGLRQGFSPAPSEPALLQRGVRRGGEAVVELEIAEEVSGNGQGEKQPPEAVSPLPEAKEGTKGEIIYSQAWRG